MIQLVKNSNAKGFKRQLANVIRKETNWANVNTNLRVELLLNQEIKYAELLMQVTGLVLTSQSEWTSAAFDFPPEGSG